MSDTGMGSQNLGHLEVTAAGLGVVAVGLPAGPPRAPGLPRPGVIKALSAADGKALWEIKDVDLSGHKSNQGSSRAGLPLQYWTPLVDGYLCCGDRKYDPKTGEVKGKFPVPLESDSCVQSALVGDILTVSRDGRYIEMSKYSTS